MVKLNMEFNDSETEALRRFGGNDIIILSCIEGDSFVLNENGDYSYNECFKPSDTNFFVKQKYGKVIPNRLIQFYNYYLMESTEEKGIWYRGRKDMNGNWEYECFCDSLAEAFASL